MERPAPIQGLLFGVVVSLLPGCATVVGTVRARHAAEYGCSEAEVVVDEMPGESVLARGCGWDVSYVCRGRGSATITCATDVVHRSSDRLAQNTFTPAVTAPPATGPAEAGDQRREEIAAAPQPPAVPNLASERVRAWIDAQREAILACTERTSAVVIARWDASGVVTLTLSGDLAGSTQEGCMRAATGAQQDTTGTSGELRHLVR